jgi:hypothetical protein
VSDFGGITLLDVNSKIVESAFELTGGLSACLSPVKYFRKEGFYFTRAGDFLENCFPLTRAPSVVELMYSCIRVVA